MKTFAFEKTVLMSSNSSITFRKVRLDDPYFNVSITCRFSYSLILDIERVMKAFSKITGTHLYYMGDTPMNRLVSDALRSGFIINDYLVDVRS